MTIPGCWIDAYEIGGLKGLLQEFHLGSEQLSELLVLKASDGGKNWATELVQAGANPNYIDTEGNSALSQCIQSSSTPMGGVPKHESFELAVELVSLGANPDLLYQDWIGMLELAISYDRADIAALFILAGADLEMINQDHDCKVEERMRHSDRLWAKQLLDISKKYRSRT